MLTCVCKPLAGYHAVENKTMNSLKVQAGAMAPFISPWPTKLLMFGEDVQSDQLHVPADQLELLPPVLFAVR
jgi:hypothetical protein